MDNMNLKPFHFNLNIDIKKKIFNSIENSILFYLLKIENMN